MTILVGGQSRKAGKTAVVCDIIRATPEARWLAIKISPHKHVTSSGQQSDTMRYLQAGAAAAHLIGKDDAIPVGVNRIIESNSALGLVHPDIVVFVRNPAAGAEWKPSAHAFCNAADIVVSGTSTPELLAKVKAMLAAEQR